MFPLCSFQVGLAERFTCEGNPSICLTGFDNFLKLKWIGRDKLVTSNNTYLNIIELFFLNLKIIESENLVITLTL